MRRRALLASLPAVSGLAGCLVGRDSDPFGTTTVAPTSTSSTGTAATVHTRAAIGYGYGDDSYRIDRPNAAQFAFVEPTGYEGRTPVDAFTLELGAETFSPRAAPGNGVRMPIINGVYGEDGPGGPLVFDLPTVEAEAGALVGDGTRYPLAKEDLELFSSAPSFEVNSTSVPKQLTPADRVGARVSVTNTGGRSGEFFAAVRWAFQTQGFLTARVASGETVSAAGAFRRDLTHSPFYVTVVYPGGADRYEVTIEDTD
jgi:hypothetical protein